MNKKMIHFSSSSRHKASIRTVKISSFKHILCGDLPFNNFPSKKEHFFGCSRVWNGLWKKIRAISTIIRPMTETLDSKQTFVFIRPENLINILRKSRTIPSVIKKLQILSSSQSLGILENLMF